jgi:hypothetical protein
VDAIVQTELCQKTGEASIQTEPKLCRVVDTIIQTECIYQQTVEASIQTDPILGRVVDAIVQTELCQKTGEASIQGSETTIQIRTQASSKPQCNQSPGEYLLQKSPRNKLYKNVTQNPTAIQIVSVNVKTEDDFESEHEEEMIIDNPSKQNGKIQKACSNLESTDSQITQENNDLEDQIDIKYEFDVIINSFQTESEMCETETVQNTDSASASDTPDNQTKTQMNSNRSSQVFQHNVVHNPKRSIKRKFLDDFPILKKKVTDIVNLQVQAADGIIKVVKVSEDMLIREIRKKIKEAINIDQEKQHLQIRGKETINGFSLKDYKIKSNSTKLGRGKIIQEPEKPRYSI